MSMPLSALAYDDLRIEVYFDDGHIEVDVDYDERGREVELEYVFNTTDLDEAYERVAERLNLSVAEVEDAVVRIDRDDEDYNDDDDRWEDDDDRVRDDSYYRNSSRTDAAEAIADAKEEIAEAERFVDRNPSNDRAAADLLEAKRLLADAEEAYEDREFGTAERLGDRAEYLAEDIVDGRARSNSDLQGPEMRLQSTDRVELQRQLIAVLQQLIALLQAQR
jgi:hypothetical protein